MIIDTILTVGLILLLAERTYNYKRRTHKQRQDYIDKDKGKEYIVKKIHLTYNEVHAMQLGLLFAIALSVTYLHYPQTATLIFTLLIMTTVLDRIVKPFTSRSSYATLYTIRANPWYFLTPYVLLFSLVVTYRVNSYTF